MRPTGIGPFMLEQSQLKETPVCLMHHLRHTTGKDWHQTAWTMSKSNGNQQGSPGARSHTGNNAPSFGSHNLAFAEELYLEYLTDPDSVPAEWRAWFESTDSRADGPAGAPRSSYGPEFSTGSLFRPAASGGADAGTTTAAFQHRVDKLLRNYRVRGHRVADVNPLFDNKTEIPELDPGFYGFSEQDMSQPVVADNLVGVNTLGDLIEGLKSTYTRSIGIQFMHIDNLRVRAWLQTRMERTRNRLELTRDTQLRILTRLTDATIFEDFIQKKFVGAKSFSLEGGETLIPLLDLAIEKAGSQGVKEIVLAMAHRGRLNVLANIMGKSPRTIFREFEDRDPELSRGRGDVKYHLGYSSDWTTQDGNEVHLSLCFNPSHLEFVNPVAVGRTRAKQDRFGDSERVTGMPILIHGDAAFIGQGVNQETLNMSELDGYAVGGSLHIIVNNQVGFTTGTQQARSTTYASDVAKMLQSPIFHVNGEDPEAVAQVIELAMEFRREFRRDVVIDMFCYRRLGHNEGDEPAFTQPLMYDMIRKRRGVREGYLTRLLELGEVTADEAEQIAESRRQVLEEELITARREDFQLRYSALEGNWTGYTGGLEEDTADVDTGMDADEAARLLARLAEVPDGFNVNPKLQRLMTARSEMAAGERPLDWAAAEHLALASLVTSGHRVRLTGQDSQRGTFSQRHSVLHDALTGNEFMPLANLAEDQAPIEIHNSPLSETSVLGFEYGYSLDMPDSLVMWEAQYGDFVNSAQVIIDQFIASAEDKWNRLSGVTLLLPHGFEGSGPEHSSARPERFLQLCADDNMQVVNCTTPAQYFHLLRRQVLRPLRKPLVVMSPKSLLRHPQVLSSLEEFSTGTFRRVLPDPEVTGDVSRILLCTGKIYFELLAERAARDLGDVAIIRLEQLYPLPHDELNEALAGYPQDVPVTFVQEEPANAGYWRFLLAHFGFELAGRPFTGVCRPAQASPATGSASAHRLEQAELIREAFTTEAGTTARPATAAGSRG